MPGLVQGLYMFFDGSLLSDSEEAFKSKTSSKSESNEPWKNVYKPWTSLGMSPGRALARALNELWT